MTMMKIELLITEHVLVIFLTVFTMGSICSLIEPIIKNLIQLRVFLLI
jgi:hypothetical protein